MADKKKLEAALEKKALYGEDIDLSKYDDNDEARTKSTGDLTAGGKSKLAKVGIELDGEGRSATFIQVDNAPVQVEVEKDTPLELMNTGDAAKKHPELVEKYWWKAVAPDTDKYTAKTATEREQGYFIRVRAGHKISAPLQACVFIGHEDQLQRVHNVVNHVMHSLQLVFMPDKDAGLQRSTYFVTGAYSDEIALLSFRCCFSSIFIGIRRNRFPPVFFDKLRMFFCSVTGIHKL